MSTRTDGQNCWKINGQRTNEQAIEEIIVKLIFLHFSDD